MIGLFSTEAPSDLGQAFWVVDPAVLDGSAGPFEQRLEALCADLDRGARPRPMRRAAS